MAASLPCLAGWLLPPLGDGACSVTVALVWLRVRWFVCYCVNVFPCHGGWSIWGRACPFVGGAILAFYVTSFAVLSASAWLRA